MLFSIVISQSTTQGFQEASVWKVQKGNPYSSEHSWSDKKGFRKGSSLDNSVTTLAVRKGRNEDKWSKVQPLLAPKLCIIYPEIVLRSNIRVKIADFRPQILCTESPKGARPVIISRHQGSALADCDPSEKGLQICFQLLSHVTVGEVGGVSLL